MESKPECKRVNLLGFLIKPIQRITKYPLLFRELQKDTPTDHPDYKNILTCLNKVQSVAEYVNERLRSSENLQKMMEIQDNLTDSKGWHVIQPARKFIKDGELLMATKGGKLKEKYLFLFNDVLLITKPQFAKKTTYQFVESIPMDCSLIQSLPDSDSVSNGFELIRSDAKMKYSFSAHSNMEKNAWVREFSSQIEFHLKKAKERHHEQAQIAATLTITPKTITATYIPGSSPKITETTKKMN